MQTKTIFRLAPALLLAGAAMLGLGPWENAAGQGQAPILFSEDPQGFNECIVNDGVFAIVGDEGDAQCTPRPPGWTPPPPPPPPEVAPQPGGIIIQEPVVAPPPAANPAPRRAPQQSTVVLDFDDHLDYGDVHTCGNLGGKTEFAGPRNDKAICSEIDINDTFCFVDSKDAFPCAGLFRHVGVCNGLYNRPALDPWHCAALCPPEKYACGNRCLRGGIAPPPRFVDSRKRIPYVAGNYSGEVFQLTATMKAGNVRLGLAEAGPDLAVTPVGRARDVAAVKLSRPIGAGSQRAGALRAGFSCAGPEQAFGATMFAFTISALAAVTEFEREAPARINPTLANPTLFGTNSPGIYIPDVYERVQVTRTGGNFELESSVYDSQDVEAEALVVRGTLEYFQTYTLHLDAVSPQVRGAVSLVVKTSIRCARFRWDDYDGLVEFPDFSNSYRKLTVALVSGDANAMCEALRIGAAPNREIWNPKGRKTERVLSFPTFTVTQTRYYPTATTPMLQLLSRTEATPRLYQMVKALVENGWIRTLSPRTSIFSGRATGCCITPPRGGTRRPRRFGRCSTRARTFTPLATGATRRCIAPPAGGTTWRHSPRFWKGRPPSTSGPTTAQPPCIGRIPRMRPPRLRRCCGAGRKPTGGTGAVGRPLIIWSWPTPPAACAPCATMGRI